jgi:MarR family transcriptional regulator, organic hydroperoxide resistance regulator
MRTPVAERSSRTIPDLFELKIHGVGCEAGSVTPMMLAMSKRSDRRPEESLDRVLDFMRILWKLEHGLQATSKRMGSRMGITGPQRLVLRIVTQFPNTSAGDVARILHLHPSTITGILQRLVDKGLLLRERDRHDTRRVRLRPRPRAQRLARRSAGTVEAAVAKVLERTPTKHVQHARGVVDAIARALDDVG